MFFLCIRLFWQILLFPIILNDLVNGNWLREKMTLKDPEGLMSLIKMCRKSITSLISLIFFSFEVIKKKWVTKWVIEKLGNKLSNHQHINLNFYLGPFGRRRGCAADGAAPCGGRHRRRPQQDQERGAGLWRLLWRWLQLFAAHERCLGEWGAGRGRCCHGQVFILNYDCSKIMNGNIFWYWIRISWSRLAWGVSGIEKVQPNL